MANLWTQNGKKSRYISTPKTLFLSLVLIYSSMAHQYQQTPPPYGGQFMSSYGPPVRHYNPPPMHSIPVSYYQHQYLGPPTSTFQVTSYPQPAPAPVAMTQGSYYDQRASTKPIQAHYQRYTGPMPSYSRTRMSYESTPMSHPVSHNPHYGPSHQHTPMTSPVSPQVPSYQVPSMTSHASSYQSPPMSYPVSRHQAHSVSPPTSHTSPLSSHHTHTVHPPHPPTSHTSPLSSYHTHTAPPTHSPASYHYAYNAPTAPVDNNQEYPHPQSSTSPGGDENSSKYRVTSSSGTSVIGPNFSKISVKEQAVITPNEIPIIYLKHDILGTEVNNVTFKTGNGIDSSESTRVVPVFRGDGYSDSEVKSMLVKTGRISYISPEGTRVLLVYRADANGYQPTITMIEGSKMSKPESTFPGQVSNPPHGGVPHGGPPQTVMYVVPMTDTNYQ